MACRSRGHRHAQRRCKRWRNILLHGRHRVLSRSHCRAHKHQRDRDVIFPWGTVHVRYVRVTPRDEIAFARHDHELAGSSGKVCSSEHLEEALSLRRGGSISRLSTAHSSRVRPQRSIALLAGNRASHRDQGQDEEGGTAGGQPRGDGKGLRRCHRTRFTSSWTAVPGPDPTNPQSLRPACISQPSFICSSCRNLRDIIARTAFHYRQHSSCPQTSAA